MFWLFFHFTDPVNELVKIGSDVVLTCDTSLADVTWETPFGQRSGHNLTVKDVKKTDAGVYLCYVKNDTGVFIASTIHLIVLCE